MTKKLKKVFATMLTMSLLANTSNVVVFADSSEPSDRSNVLEEIIKTSAKEIEDGVYEITTKVDFEGQEFKVRSASNAECICENLATDSDCTATDSDCSANGCNCGNEIVEMVYRYEDLVISDSTSKWIVMDPESLKIWDLNSGNIICEYDAETEEYEWVSGYASEGASIEVDTEDSSSNTSELMHTITWNVKSGELDENTSYKMTYQVRIDEEERDIVDGKTYPVSRNIYAEYVDFGEDAAMQIDSAKVVAEVVQNKQLSELGNLASKSSKLFDREDNRYTIKLSVPGEDAPEDKTHDEVILMVDGSYSMDNEWPAMKTAINTIGETVLNGSGTTQLTLMAFGMGDNEVLVHVKDAEDLANALGALPGNLLYGRSSTNCEAGFDGVANYIKNHDETLADVHVIFISDGNLNTDETPRAFDTNWKTYATKFGSLTVAQTAFEETLLYGENLPEAYTAMFGERFANATDVYEILNRAFGGEVTNDEFMNFAEQLWVDVYEYSGLTCGVEYPVSVAERAFVKYDKEKGTYIQDLFYYTTYKSSYVTYGNRWTRTPLAANELAAMSEVASMYVVDYDGYTSWMDTGITNPKSIFVQSAGIAGLCDALEEALIELSRTPYNDVVVTDYMSKWVNLDTTSIRIVDDKTGDMIYSSKDGWLVDKSVRPTSEEVPVIIELVSPAEYADGGEDVIGNTNGDIYKLTWYVKDGALLRADDYHLEYEVVVDTEETDFEYDKEYPANGNTIVDHTDENGDRRYSPIEVPDVEAPKGEPTTPPQQDDPSQPSNPPQQDDPSQPSNPPQQDDPSQPSNPPQQNDPEPYEPEEEPAHVPGQVLDAFDEEEPEIPTGVLGAFDILEIVDDMIPLGVLPATGDLSVIWFAISILSALGLAGTSMIERKKRK